MSAIQKIHTVKNIDAILQDAKKYRRNTEKNSVTKLNLYQSVGDPNHKSSRVKHVSWLGIAWLFLIL